MVNITQKYRKYRKRKQERIIGNENRDNALEVQNIIPLAQRWPSEEGVRGDRAREGSEETELAEVSIAEVHFCDENSRMMGEINGVKVKMLIDTGAHISLFSVKTAKKLNITKVHHPEFTGVIGIGENIVPALSQTTAEIVIAGCRILTPIVFIKDEESKGGLYDVIIGRRTLRDMPYLLDLETGQMIPKGSVRDCLRAEILEISSAGDKNILSVESEIKTDLGGEDKQKLLECLRTNQDVFSKNDYDLGECTISAPPILTSSETPILSRPYRVPEKYQAELDKHIDAMLRVGVLEKSNTPWVSPVVIVQKSDGNLRPCVDFRALNKIAVTDPYPIPKMETVLHKVAGKKFYTSLDLSSGFWQIPLEENSAFKCGIITERGVFVMKKLPFGLKNSPAIFQRIMNEILTGLNSVCAYIDDILVYTNTLDEHLEILRGL